MNEQTREINEINNPVDSSFIDRRTINKRRANKPCWFCIPAFLGRRRQVRRTEDKHNTSYYLDWYDTRLLLVVMVTVLLCIADAIFTLRLIALGGEELNILMDIFINTSIFLFITVKYSLTAGGLVFLVAHRHFNIWKPIKVEHLIYSVLLIYLTLICYELTILPDANVSFNNKLLVFK
jgi:hypothetical protein